MAKSNLRDILAEFLKVSGVTVAAAVGRDGFVIEHVSSVTVDMDALGAMVATAIGTTESLGMELKLGDMDQYLAEFKTGKILIAGAGNDILVLVTDPTAVIGGVRYAMRKNMPDVMKAL